MQQDEPAAADSLPAEETVLDIPAPHLTHHTAEKGGYPPAAANTASSLPQTKEGDNIPPAQIQGKKAEASPVVNNAAVTPPPPPKTAERIPPAAQQQADLNQARIYEDMPAPAPIKQPDAKALEEAGLVDVETLPIKVFLDIRYATPNNFVEEKLYDNAKCYLKKPVADALVNAAKYARQEEVPFNFCIYDCYRPLAVQKIMFARFPAPGYVSNPAAGSNHNRGAAIDLGPCNESGINFPMPTDFDDFTPKAAAFAEDADIPKTAIKNREMLQRVMRKAGFTTIRKEWWHFDYKDAKEYPLLDIPF